MRPLILATPHIGAIQAPFVKSFVDMVQKMAADGIDFTVEHTYRENITFARNRLATIALRKKSNIFFVDDDMVFDPDLYEKVYDRFEQLNSYNIHEKLEKEVKPLAGIVGALTFIRSEPHWPSMFNHTTDGEKFNPIVPWEPGEIVKCTAVGMAATLVSYEAMRAVATKSEIRNDIFGLFDNFNGWGEDVRFCTRAGNMGYGVFVDTGILVKHLVTKEIGYGDFAAFQQDSNRGAIKFMEQKKYENKRKTVSAA